MKKIDQFNKSAAQKWTGFLRGFCLPQTVLFLFIMIQCNSIFNKKAISMEGKYGHTA